MLELCVFAPYLNCPFRLVTLISITAMGQCCSGETSDKPPPNASTASGAAPATGPGGTAPSNPSATAKAGSSNTNVAKSNFTSKSASNPASKITVGQQSKASGPNTPRVSQLKLTRGPPIKFVVDQKEIMAVIKEKETMRRDVAKIGTGQTPSPDRVQPKSSKDGSVKPKSSLDYPSQSSTRSVASKSEKSEPPSCAKRVEESYSKK